MLPSGHEVGAGSAMVSKMILETFITVETFPPDRGFCFHQEKSFQDHRGPHDGKGGILSHLPHKSAGGVALASWPARSVWPWALHSQFVLALGAPEPYLVALGAPRPKPARPAPGTR